MQSPRAPQHIPRPKSPVSVLTPENSPLIETTLDKAAIQAQLDRLKAETRNLVEKIKVEVYKNGKSGLSDSAIQRRREIIGTPMMWEGKTVVGASGLEGIIKAASSKNFDGETVAIAQSIIDALNDLAVISVKEMRAGTPYPTKVAVNRVLKAIGEPELP